MGIHRTDALFQIINNEGRKDFPQVCGDNTGTVARHDFAETGGRFVRQEITDTLGRSPESAAAGTEGGLFNAALENESCQGMFISKILRTDAYQQG